MTHLTAAIYARGFGMAEDLQVERCRALAGRHAFRHHLLFREGDPALPPAAIPPRLALKAATERGEVGAVFCTSPDRHSRDALEVSFILAWAARLGVALHFVAE